jgi:hypothetical protein
MKKIALISLSIILMFNSLTAFGWGAVGHDVIASIAEQNLTRKAKRNLDKILDGKSIVYYASWMDNIQNSPAWKGGYDKTKTWHYANVDKGLTYKTMEKNPSGDVITALNELTAQLEHNFKNLSDSLKADYVKMIVHMVGDLHCPMHAGRLSDRGGNFTKVKWFGQETNIHSVWDSRIVESARKWHYSEWAEQLDHHNRKFKKSVTQGSYEDWFTSTVANAAAIYDYVEKIETEDLPYLSYQFVYDFSPMLEQSLLLGGYRLAHVLNEIFD